MDKSYGIYCSYLLLLWIKAMAFIVIVHNWLYTFSLLFWVFLEVLSLIFFDGRSLDFVLPLLLIDIALPLFDIVKTKCIQDYSV